MKKTKIIELLFVFTLLFTVACSKVDKETQAVIDQIKSIGEVDYDDQVLISQIEDAYAALTDEQKKQVSNLDKLIAARHELDEIIKNHPIPFCAANWKTTEEELTVIMDRAPDDEGYDSDGNRYLEYAGMKYEGINVRVQYYFADENLYMATCIYDAYDEEIFNHFDELFADQYGKPSYEFSNGFGEVKRWDLENLTVGVAWVDISLGRNQRSEVKCFFRTPLLSEEE